jgi:hypothetical protein
MEWQIALFSARAILISLIWLCGFAVDGAIVFFVFVTSYDIAREIYTRALRAAEES